MTRRTTHRWYGLLGLLAMLGAVLAVPAAAMAAAAKAPPASAASSSMGKHEGMPCEKPCPDCPKSHHDMAGCMLKCFNPAATLPDALLVERIDATQLLGPVPPVAQSDMRVPPPLRPPSA